MEIQIKGGQGNTTQLVNNATKYNELRMRQNGSGFDHLWIVFDKDDFPDEHFNEAVFDAKRKNIEAAYSNESFELWLLLHFEFLNSAIGRNQYADKLNKYMGVYKKSEPDIYRKVSEAGNESEAILRAKKLFDSYDHNSPAKENPSTRVHLLIEALLEFRKAN